MKYSHADAKDEVNEAIPVSGRVRLYVSSGQPDSVSIQDKAAMSVRSPVYTALSSLLPIISKAFPTLEGESHFEVILIHILI
jgi:hypothetical protein